jgi:imidazolonepropionase-like amidohydrolase
MTPEVYNAVIDEAHKHGMLVQAHAIAMPDQKAVVSAGVDVLVHTVQNEKLDDEFLAMLREHKPYWTTVIGLGDRSEVCENDPFIDQSYPPSVLETIRRTGCGAPNANSANREAILANNLPLYVKNGARIMLGTDAGITPRYSFGWADHHEMTRWVTSGLTPAEAIVGATSRPAEYLGLKDLGTLATGKSADFVVLNANPLDNIRNTRQIDSVYTRGEKVDRAALAKQFRKGE